MKSSQVLLEQGGERAASAPLCVKTTELREAVGSPLSPGGRHTALTYKSLLDGEDENQRRAWLRARGGGIINPPLSLQLLRESESIQNVTTSASDGVNEECTSDFASATFFFPPSGGTTVENVSF